MKIIQSINKNALIIATISFLIGTILLLLQLIIGWEQLIFIGIFYVLIASALNGITFIGLLANTIINYHYYKENLVTISICLLNIPIAIGYISLVINNPFHNTFL
ncbi:hypothetical protein [Aquimarina sp. 2201CG14-23]|uniref:hypothetical protein n=1 Tax=Aquimarina mycalae TaxID=3040073 RepID=UPI0024781EE3|nr:hypothetical protein [Aquimarina sp. 2201CG14-23]MDH7444997.1 hypothetical protein [Aquimarina sp. 2201CG14-23]